MNYELARELQDAGWGRGKDDYCPPSLMCCEITLEELIEACGDDILGLNRTHDDSGEPNGWVADTHTHACDCGKDNCFGFNWEHESGATPTVAVARLWLALKANTTV